MTLSADVLGHALRLGAIPRSSPPPEDDSAIPSFVRDFTIGLSWPEEHSFDADSEEDDVWSVEFRYGGLFDHELAEVVGCEGRRLYEIGIYDGGNWFLLLDAGDPNPSNPTVFSVDHYDPGQELYPLGQLAEFLRNLRPNE